MPQNRNIEQVKINKLLTGVNESVITKLFNQENFTRVIEGEIIYQNGQESRYLYLLIGGQVKIKYSATNYISTKVSTDFFGEKEIIESTRRKSSAVAYKTSLLYKIDKKLFKEMVQKIQTVYENVQNFGELVLPQSNNETKRTFNIETNFKPRSFKATKEFQPSLPNDKKSTAATEQLNDDKSDDAIRAPVDLVIGDDTRDIQFSDDAYIGNNIDHKINFENKPAKKNPAEENPPITKAEDKPEEPGPASKSSEDILFDRETLRKIFGCIEKINSGISRIQTIYAIKNALKDFTVSEAAEILLIDEDASEMKKFVKTTNELSETKFGFPEGLTGTCALQKKILNFERPTEDSRFESEIDQPGHVNLKRILFFPILNSAGETIAVIQLARENKKFTEKDIAYLNLMTKPVENALIKAATFEDLLLNEKLTVSRKLSKILLGDIDSAVNIISSYAEALSNSNLSEELDEIIRMLQKQANSVDDLSSALFSIAQKEFDLNTNQIHFNEFVDDILEVLTEYCESKSVKLYKRIGDGAVVNLDRTKFYTGIYHIIKRACEESSANGRIYFSTELAENSIHLIIKDEGKAEPKQQDYDLLKLAYEADNPDEKNISIAIAKRIFEAHSCALYIETVNGEGTEYKITVPVSNNE